MDEYNAANARNEHMMMVADYPETFPNDEALDPQQFMVPEVVKQFVCYLHKYIRERKVSEIHTMYETSFNNITEKYFKQDAWPDAESIAPLVSNGISLTYARICELVV
jgi:hypothetical protein